MAEGVGGNAQPVREVDLDWRSVAWVLAGLVALVLVAGVVRAAPQAFTVVAVSGLLALALTPPVASLQRRLGLSRPAAVAVLIGALAAIAAVAAILLVPPAARQARELGRDLDEVVDEVERLPVIGDELRQAGAAEKARQWVEGLPDRLEGDDTPLGAAARRVADGLVAALFAALVTVALLLDGDHLVRGARRLFPPSRRPLADRLGRLAYLTVGRYVAGSVLVAAIAGGAVLVVGLVLGVPLTPLLALWVAVFDLVPQIGGAAGGIPFVLLGLTQGVVKGLVCAVFFVLYLQFENHVLSPLVVGRTVRLSPPATMTAALVGVAAGGVVGALLSVPVVASAKAVYLDLRSGPSGRRFGAGGEGNASPMSEAETTTDAEVTSVALEDEDGTTFVVAQQNTGASEDVEGGGEFPDPGTPPRPPAPGAAG